MSIRAKIVGLVLAIAVAEAALMGTIAFTGVHHLSRPAGELRGIGQAVADARGVGGALARASDPDRVFLPEDGRAAERFSADMDEVQRRFDGCVASMCHGHGTGPPLATLRIADDLKSIRERGLRAIAARGPGRPIPLREWNAVVGAPSRDIAIRSDRMSNAVMVRAREIDEAAKDEERRSVRLVILSTVASVLATIGLCFVVARGIARPIENLAAQSRRISAGDLGARAAEEGPHEVRALAGSFNRMIDQLAAHRARLEEDYRRAARLAGVGLFAEAVAHDLSNPLTSVVLNAEVLAEAVPKEDARRGVAEDILRETRRCHKIASELRAVSREGGEIEKVPCSIGAVVNDAVRITGPGCDSRKIRVVAETGPEPASGGCSCAPVQILQVLINLIESAEGEEVRVRVRLRERLLAVEVEGRGRRDLGLRWEVTRRIVERHGGTIEIEGPVARVVLPRKDDGRSC
ncbi:MAG: HAMP domain-containing protein [Planctomycetes bacterium]|nr:HAMP domain-containing protein [Planctomycetota bacterium]